MNRIYTRTAVLLFAASLCGTALAAGNDDYENKAKKAKPSFSQLDTDSSGTLSQAEIRNAGSMKGSDRLSSKWSELDKNRDGELDESEFSAFKSNEGDSRRDHTYKEDGDYDTDRQ